MSMVMSQNQYQLYLKRVREYMTEWNGHAHPLTDTKVMRMGQSYFNVLFMYWPDIADFIRGTEYDPFYDDGIIDKFLSYLYENHVS